MANTGTFVAEITFDNGVFGSVWKGEEGGSLILSNFPTSATPETLTPDGATTYGEMATWEAVFHCEDEDVVKLAGLAARTLKMAAL